MVRYIGRRGLQAVAVIWAAFTLAFVVLYLMPSDPAQIIASGGMMGEAGSAASEQQLADLRAELGLDRPVVEQYGSALAGTATGQWGTSYQTGQPVLQMLGENLPATLAVTFTGLAIAIVAGLSLGFAATFARFEPLRQLLLSLPSIGASIPTFWSALLLMQVFSFGLRWFPAFGNQGPAALVLPSLALAIPVSAVIAQVFAKSLRTVMTEPFVDVVRAKGASRSRAMLGHAVRNALLPVLTMIGMLLGAMLSGTVVIETVFARQGFGRMTVDAVNAQDIPVVMGVVVFSAIVFVVTSLLVDLLYPLLDPRIRRAGSTPRPQPVKVA